MLQVAAEVVERAPRPDRRVPVLTPRLSSYWLALVTDVDVTTGRNLIDSMGTEVVVTDDVDPRDRARRADDRTPRPCAARWRRRRLTLSRRSPAARRASQRPGDVGEDRREDAAGRPALEADDDAEQDRREGEHHVAGGQRGDDVGDRRDQATGCRGIAAYTAPRKNSSSAMPLTAVISTSSGNDALVGEVEHRPDLARRARSISRTTSPPATKTPARARPTRIGCDAPAGRVVRSGPRSGRGAAARRRTRRPSTPRPGRGSRGRTTGCRARSAGTARGRVPPSTTNATVTSCRRRSAAGLSRWSRGTTSHSDRCSQARTGSPLSSSGDSTARVARQRRPELKDDGAVVARAAGAGLGRTGAASRPVPVAVPGRRLAAAPLPAGRHRCRPPLAAATAT